MNGWAWARKMLNSILESHGMNADGRIPPAYDFPYISGLINKPVSRIDGTRDDLYSTSYAHGGLLEDVYQAFQFAYHAFPNLDKKQLFQALNEANILARSRLFGDALYPEVCVDPYGEFTFSHSSEAGYVDVGVRGDGELSYHVRNDVDPAETKFDDYDWSDRDIPQDLFTALKSLRKHL